MNILYGLAGEGFGHSSRALVIANYLEKKGHKVILVTYGQGYDALKGKFKIFRVKGPRPIYRGDRLVKHKTLEFNLKHLPKNLKNWKKFYDLMDSFKPKLCISDMELFVPMLSNWYHLPLISIDNQHRLTNCEIEVPKKYYQDYLLAREVTRTFVGKADDYIVTSFSPLKTIKKNTFVVPPIVREDVKKIKPKTENFTLVYLTKKNQEIINILKSTDEKFIIYGYNIEKKDKNLEFKFKTSFLRDLANCKAIIATAGFTLISEALYLKKPYLALPLNGQFEQTLNALVLKKAEFGEYSENLSRKEIESFLSNLNKYRGRLKKYNPDYNKLYKIIDLIIGKIK